ncbi:VOC family protein, partial [Mycobacterium tuberculosis]
YQAQKAEKVGAVNIVVSDLERSVKFYTEVLEFTKIGEEQMIGSEFEQLFGVFGMNAKVAHLQLGEEKVDLVDFLTTGGSPVPLNQK